jgi:hypothetical protein
LLREYVFSDRHGTTAATPNFGLQLQRQGEAME